MTAAGSADGLSLFTAHVEGAGGGLLWLYVWNIVIIVGVYTPLTVAAALTCGWTEDVMGVGLADDRLRHLRYMYFAIILNLLKDCFQPFRASMTTLLLLHHIFSMLALGLILFLPCAGAYCGFGQYILELGTLVYDAWCVDAFMQRYRAWPPAVLVDWAYYVFNTLSNVAGACILLRALWVCRTPGLGFVTVVALIIFYIRQDECNKAFKGSAPKPHCVDPSSVKKTS
jgi:hypothetical protein